MVESNGIWNIESRDHLFDLPHNKIHNAASYCSQHITKSGDDYMSSWNFVKYAFQVVCKVFKYDNRGDTSVFKLVLHLARSVERIRTDNNQTCLPRSDQGNGKLQDIWHLNRDTIALDKTEFFLKKCSERS